LGGGVGGDASARAAHGELLLSFFFSVLHLFLNFFFFSWQVWCEDAVAWVTWIW
jgi:hypothetical protein